MSVSRKQYRKELPTALKMNKLFLDENVESKLCKFVGNNFNIKNVLTYHQLAKLFKLLSCSESTFSYIERNFTMIVETKNFLEVGCIEVLKILRRSELSITSELEVYNSASKWLSHNVKERIEFAKELLLTVRFPLLSDGTMKYILNGCSPFCQFNFCYKILKEISEGKILISKISQVFIIQPDTVLKRCLTF